MNMPSLTAALADVWPMIIGGTIGSAVAHLISQRSPNAARIRKQLGRSIDAYSSLSALQLDKALVASAVEAKSGFRVLRPILCITMLFIFAGISAQIYRDSFPQVPRWHGYCVAGLVAGLMTWPMQWLERRAIVSRLRQILPNQS
jgi:hypothetical protein